MSEVFGVKTPLLLRALNGENLTAPPVWLMRQAGRYLPEYRALKEKHSFLEMCKSPELAAEVTMQPLRRFALDAAILFADIMLPLECLGLKVDFSPGPQLDRQIRSPLDISELNLHPVEQILSYVFSSVSLIRSRLEPAAERIRPAFLGFAGAPWTLACYLIDQRSFKNFHGTHVFAAEHPAALEQLLDKLARMTIDYLYGQIEAGVDAVQLFDTWAGSLSQESYRRFALPSVRRITEAVKRKQRPVILYVNGCSHLLPALREAGADAISIDWRTGLREAEQILGSGISLQGNLDPACLFAPPEQVRAAAGRAVCSLERRTGYIANLGHGILPETPVEGVAAFIEGARNGWKNV